jgi:peroxiredoxin
MLCKQMPLCGIARLTLQEPAREIDIKMEVRCMAQLIPRQAVPALEVQTVGNGAWRLKDESPENFTLIVFYRGLHCPICRRYLLELQGCLDEFQKLGVGAVAISSDSEERAIETKREWKLDKLTIGYGLSIENGRDWGLFVSTARNEKEPDLFIEPGLFLVRPDGTLYASVVNTMPFARPSFKQLIESITFIIDRDYPARGEVI